MIADLKPLGSAPRVLVNEAWRTPRFGRISKLRTEKNRPKLDLLSVFLGRGVIPYAEGGGQVHKPSLDLSGYQVVRQGDLVLPNQQAWRGSVGVSKYDGIISPAYLVFTLGAHLNADFANYLFQSGVMVNQFVTSSKGVGDIQRDIHNPWLKNVRVPVPTLEEQTAIVRFLDYVNQRIRRHIRAKQKLIELLEEQKQAIIHRAVTRGLDPDIPLKPSGVEWLGDVPEHWEIRRLGDSVADCVNGVWGSEPNGLDDLPCVRVADFDRHRLRVRMETPTIRAIAPNERRRRMLKSGDLLLEKSGGGNQQPVGVVMLYDHDVPAVCSNFVARMPVNEGFDSGFLTFLHSALYAIRLNTRSIKQTTGIQNIDASAYLGQPVSFPHLSEQTVIVEYLDKATADIDTAIGRARREIELLPEYRTRLVADVVTGKLDVREAAASLPEEPDKPKPLDAADGLMKNDEEMAADLADILEEAEP